MRVLDSRLPEGRFTPLAVVRSAPGLAVCFSVFISRPYFTFYRLHLPRVTHLRVSLVIRRLISLQRHAPPAAHLTSARPSTNLPARSSFPDSSLSPPSPTAWPPFLAASRITPSFPRLEKPDCRLAEHQSDKNPGTPGPGIYFGAADSVRKLFAIAEM